MDGSRERAQAGTNGKAAPPRDDSPHGPSPCREWSALERIGDLAQQRLHDELVERDLDLPDFGLLAAVLQEPGATPSDLGERLRWRRATVTVRVARLHRRDLLLRGTDARDGRLTRVTLSARGEALVRGILTRQSSPLHRVLDCLADDERERFREVLERIERSLTDTRHRRSTSCGR